MIPLMQDAARRQLYHEDRARKLRANGATDEQILELLPLMGGEPAGT